MSLYCFRFFGARIFCFLNFLCSIFSVCALHLQTIEHFVFVARWVWLSVSTKPLFRHWNERNWRKIQISQLTALCFAVSTTSAVGIVAAWWCCIHTDDGLESKLSRHEHSAVQTNIEYAAQTPTHLLPTRSNWNFEKNVYFIFDFCSIHDSVSTLVER